MYSEFKVGDDIFYNQVDCPVVEQPLTDERAEDISPIGQYQHMDQKEFAALVLEPLTAVGERDVARSDVKVNVCLQSVKHAIWEASWPIRNI